MNGKQPKAGPAESPLVQTAGVERLFGRHSWLKEAVLHAREKLYP